MSAAGTSAARRWPSACHSCSRWKRLSAAEQEALALTVFDDLTSPQAALVLGITSTAYRLRLMRARRALTGLMDSPEKRRVPTALTEEYPA